MQHPTEPAPAPRPCPPREVRTVWRPPTEGPAADTWRCTGCDTYVANAVVVCETCGVDRWGKDTYDYTADSRPEHAVVLTWSDGESAVDAIKADTPEQAVEAARANWSDATVTLAEVVEAGRC